MTTAARSASADRPRRARGGSRDLLDDLKCQAQGVQAQADYNKAQGPALDEAQAAYDQARAAYSAARATAEPLVQQARDKLEECVDRVTCRIDEADRDCLARAYDRVADRLRRCGDNEGCCWEGECDYDDDVHRCEPDEVAGLIADISRRTQDAAACFADLIKEPAPALPDRVTARRAEVDDIVAAIDAGATDPIELYARILVARRRLKGVYRGFRTVNDYMDCLAATLTCMVKGHAAIAELTRKAAIHACHRAAWQQACNRLATDTVAEVLAEYIRLCGEDGEGEAGEYSGGQPASQYGEQPPAGYGERPPQPYGEQPPEGQGERPPQPYGEQPPEGYGERPPQPYGEQPPEGQGERPPQPYGGRPPQPYGERPPEGYGERPSQQYETGPGPGAEPEPEPEPRPEPGYGGTPPSGAEGEDRRRRPPRRGTARQPYRDERGRYRAP